MKALSPRERRSDAEPYQSGRLDDGIRRYFDHISESTIVKITAGDCYVSEHPGETLVTILGSCISACIRDPLLALGGMNHFLLPSSSFEDSGKSLRFGCHAMEQLINRLLSLGADRRRLEVKIFGGGHVISTQMDIGERNIRFVREYLANEKLSVSSEDVGGELPRRVHYRPDTGKVKLRRLRRREDKEIAIKEEVYLTSINMDGMEGEIELFR